MPASDAASRRGVAGAGRDDHGPFPLLHVERAPTRLDARERAEPVDRDRRVTDARHALVLGGRGEPVERQRALVDVDRQLEVVLPRRRRRRVGASAVVVAGLGGRAQDRLGLVGRDEHLAVTADRKHAARRSRIGERSLLLRAGFVDVDALRRRPEPLRGPAQGLLVDGDVADHGLEVRLGREPHVGQLLDLVRGQAHVLQHRDALGERLRLLLEELAERRLGPLGERLRHLLELRREQQMEAVRGSRPRPSRRPSCRRPARTPKRTRRGTRSGSSPRTPRRPPGSAASQPSSGARRVPGTAPTNMATAATVATTTTRGERITPRRSVKGRA